MVKYKYVFIKFKMVIDTLIYQFSLLRKIFFLIICLLFYSFTDFIIKVDRWKSHQYFEGYTKSNKKQWLIRKKILAFPHVITLSTFIERYKKDSVVIQRSSIQINRATFWPKESVIVKRLSRKSDRTKFHQLFWQLS